MPQELSSPPTKAAPIPERVHLADQAHHALLREVSFSQHLNPLNEAEARRAFLHGRALEPPFRYQPLVEADALLRRLDDVEPPRDHPLGEVVGRCMDGTRLLIRALRDRSAESFDALAREGGWYPDPALLAVRFAPEPSDGGPFDVRADQMMERLRMALDERGMADWRILPDRVMAARVLVDGAKRVIRVSPDSLFRARDLDRLVVHEIDVHVQRAVNGQAQALRVFETGLPEALQAEEGLAMLAEQRAGVATPGALARQAVVVRAIDMARRVGFRELYEALAAEVGPGLAWGIGLRIKRGLARPGEPGVYAKDSVYLAGFLQVQAWLEAGRDMRALYVGKVGLRDPVGDWVAAGWVRWQPVPAIWSLSRPGSAPASLEIPP